MPVSEVAEAMGENDTKLWRIMRGYAEAARSGKDESEAKRMGTDETSAKGRSCTTVSADAQRKEAIYAAEARTMPSQTDSRAIPKP